MAEDGNRLRTDRRSPPTTPAYLALTYGRISAHRFSPIPLIRRRSSTARYGLPSMIRRAITGPTPGRDSNSCWLAELMLRMRDGVVESFACCFVQLRSTYDHALGERGRTATILVATSGDTGGAAVEAFRGMANVRLVVLYPHGRISEVQRRFITTAQEDSVRVLAVDGVFDDCRRS